MNIDDDHFFAPFVTYRFVNSARLTKEVIYNIEQLRKQQLLQVYKRAHQQFPDDPFFQFEKQVLKRFYQQDFVQDYNDFKFLEERDPKIPMPLSHKGHHHSSRHHSHSNLEDASADDNS